MLNEHFAILGALLPFMGSCTYAHATLKGRVRPNRVTWSLWTAIPLIIFAAELSKAAGVQSLFTLAAGAGPALVMLAVLRTPNPYWRIVPFDVYCAICCGVALMLWAITREGDVAILLSILADLFAALPTVIKAHRDATTEHVNAYILTAVGAVIVILTITHWTIANFAFPLYALVLTTYLSIVLLRGRPNARAIT